ncbi:MAG TPA: ABC transporter ATP-binding protein [Candidatus Binatia bacterium]|nr:ABC transporter ATP-binding protein [Candidatus Binatia bacterium]
MAETTGATRMAPVTIRGARAHSGAAADVVISVDGVRKRYGSVVAVDGVSFEVARGEIFGLLGPNGAGKTTTVEMLEGLRRPDEGSLRVLGVDVTVEPEALKPRIGVALQTAALYPRLTVDELLRLFASFYPRHVPLDELVDALGLAERRRALTQQLSGGQRQRLAVALALLNDPEVVFLDEPTTGLDPAARRALWEIIEGLRARGRTVLLTTHYMEEAEVLCDRVAIMDHGRILEIGTVKELVGRRFHERVVHLDAVDGLGREDLASLPGVVRVSHDDGEVVLYSRDVPATIGGLLARAEERGIEIENLGIRRPSLEDVFLALTGRTLRD